MGITIHYHGRLKAEPLLSAMVEEVKEIADVNKWNYQLFETEFPETIGRGIVGESALYGMLLKVPDCESIMLCFLDDRRIINPLWLHLIETGETDEAEYRYSAFTKTLFGGIDAHLRIIHLLKYLSVKYFEHFELMDEAEYWETGDEDKARKKFNFLGKMINKLSDALSDIQAGPTETVLQLADRINQRLKDFFNDRISKE